MSVFSLFGKGVSTVRGVHIRFRKSLPANERIKLRIYRNVHFMRRVRGVLCHS